VERAVICRAISTQGLNKIFSLNSPVYGMHRRLDLPEVIQYHPVLEMGRYVPIYHTGTHHYVLCPVIFIFTVMAMYRCFTFKRYTDRPISSVEYK
jgi:hypothetical protein